MKRRPRITGATDAERTNGIGFQVGTPPPGWHADPWASRAGEARRGAAAMRARAFNALTFTEGWTVDQIHPGVGGAFRVPGDPTYVAAWWEERVHGCPAWGKEA